MEEEITPQAELSIRLHKKGDGVQLEIVNHVEQDDLITMIGCLLEQRDRPVVKSTLAIIAAITHYYDMDLSGNL